MRVDLVVAVLGSCWGRVCPHACVVVVHPAGALSLWHAKGIVCCYIAGNNLPLQLPNIQRRRGGGEGGGERGQERERSREVKRGQERSRERGQERERSRERERGRERESVCVCVCEGWEVCHKHRQTDTDTDTDTDTYLSAQLDFGVGLEACECLIHGRAWVWKGVAVDCKLCFSNPLEQMVCNATSSRNLSVNAQRGAIASTKWAPVSLSIIRRKMCRVCVCVCVCV